MWSWVAGLRQRRKKERPLHHAAHGPPPPLRRGGTGGDAVRDLDPPPFTGEGDHEVVEGAYADHRHFFLFFTGFAAFALAADFAAFDLSSGFFRDASFDSCFV